MRAAPYRAPQPITSNHRGHALAQFRDEEEIEGFLKSMKGFGKAAVRKQREIFGREGGEVYAAKLQAEFKELCLAVMYYKGLCTQLDTLIANPEDKKVWFPDRHTGEDVQRVEMSAEYLEMEKEKARQSVVSFWIQLQSTKQYRLDHRDAQEDFLAMKKLIKHPVSDGIKAMYASLRARMRQNS